ncbi:hypothetical protein Pfo_011707 [Paulownia fortunei]|nr:hypothetical protein Pfo_011707 [Paulownia fortunei]
MPPNSINSFDEFSSTFLHQFVSSRKHQKISLTLFSINQKDNEALQSYIKRFTVAALEVPSATQEVLSNALAQGLKDGEFFRSLAKKSARSFDDLLARAEKYINMEEVQRMKRDEGERKRDRREKLKPKERPLLAAPGEPRQYTLLVTLRAYILMAIMKHKGLKWSYNHSATLTKPKSNLLCAFHNEDTKEGKVGTAPGENHPHAPKGFIQMILGGPTDGNSNRTRKAYARPTHENSKGDVHKINEGSMIQFEPQDMKRLQAPHNDVLVITTTMTNFDVAKVMVDMGSSIDVLLYEAYKKMNFLVVDFFSAYNIILGRPSLNTIQAVVSTFHMILKFPCSTRRCYLETIRKIEQKKTKREQSAEGEPPLKIMKRNEAEGPSVEQEHVMLNEELINIELIPRDGTRTTRIGTQLSPELADRMTQFLRNNIDIFAWNVRDLEGIDPGVAVHHLNVEPACNPKDKVIQKEVEKLLEAGHIREIQFPKWLACPKDHYPLPQIDQLIDSTSGCELLSMMDASQGYHQIMLTPEDHKKVSFITSIGTYSYDYAFWTKTCRSYISKTAHVDNLAEAFGVLRRYGMKLNPSKCAFGIRSGKFLGYMVIERGIKVNPEKVKAVQNMTPPNSINKVQQLKGRIAILSRFISRSAERNLSFFKILRKANKFEWTEECQRAFYEIKNFLAALALLTKPLQKSIYYVSKLLRGTKIKYPEIEKGGLALVTTARRLRPYFLSHKIVVRTNLPLRQVLSKPKTSGQMVKWAVEMSEYDIDYQPRGPRAWSLHIDGLATISSCGVGIVLTSLEGKELEFAVRFKFKTSNNEVEYEALVRGLKMALELRVRQLNVYFDLRLVMQQVEGEFVTKEERMRNYVEHLSHIPRAKNAKADYLSKIASSITDCKTRKITLLTAYQHNMGIEVASVEEKDDWRTNILKFLREGKLPQNKREAVQFQVRGTRFYLIDEIHERGCRSHGRGRALACKTARVGYFWPPTCEKCQKHTLLIHKLTDELKVMSSPCLFSKWGIDIVGLFPLTIGQRKFLIVAIDYFSKWVEVEPVAKIIESQVMKFMWGNIIYRYGSWCTEMKTRQHFTSVAHPQANGQVEVTNQIILQGIKIKLDRSEGGWMDELNLVLWAYRTTSRTTIKETHFSLVYGSDVVIPIDEKREKAYLHMEAYKSRIRVGYSRKVKIKKFQVGDLVLRQVDALKQTGKLKVNWEGP